MSPQRSPVSQKRSDGGGDGDGGKSEGSSAVGRSNAGPKAKDAPPSAPPPPEGKAAGTRPGRDDREQPSLAATWVAARRSRSYVLLVLGFGVCGLHVVFVTTHLPACLADEGFEPWVAATALTIIGIGNVLGTFTVGFVVGHLGGRHKQRLLAAVYATRALLFATFTLAPKTIPGTFAFSLLLGMVWLATVPLTAGLVEDMFGTAYSSTLFGLAFASHQLGSFFGAWVGGRIYDTAGSYTVMWWTCVAAAIAASLAHIPIRSDRVKIVDLAPKPPTLGTSTSTALG